MHYTGNLPFLAVAFVCLFVELFILLPMRAGVQVRTNVGVLWPGTWPFEIAQPGHAEVAFSGGCLRCLSVGVFWRLPMRAGVQVRANEGDSCPAQEALQQCR